MLRTGLVATGTTAFTVKKMTNPFATCRMIWYEPVQLLVSVVEVSRIPKHYKEEVSSELGAAIRESERWAKLIVHERPIDRMTRKLAQAAYQSRSLSATVKSITDCNHVFALNKDLRVDEMGYAGMGLTGGTVTSLLVVLGKVIHAIIQKQDQMSGWEILPPLGIGAVVGGLGGYLIERRKELEVNSRVHVNEMIRVAVEHDWKPILCVYTKKMADAVVKELLARGAVIADEKMELNAMETARPPPAAEASG